ncbi:hypothetical protein PRZ48_009548 [Zasmidium cellare]|uniref:Uncharacterized protein n=1 Tax=Zasmidium cellare TaxID=395010 RepID=A0ABR0EC06_ZASCE|nr:hypothetical protein PRZ48_009548 [Zasmidium cellare]
MSNPRVKNLQPSSNVRKNPSSTPSPAVKQANKSASAPSRPAGSSVKPTPRNPPSGTKPPAKAAPAKQAAPPKEGNWLNQTVQNTVAGAGGYVGGLINSVGGGVNKVGEGIGNTITNTTRGWGQGVAGYGNNIKDSVGVGGPRVSTGGNPLGLAGQGSAQNMKEKKAPNAVRTAGKGSASNPLGI